MLMHFHETYPELPLAHRNPRGSLFAVGFIRHQTLQPFLLSENDNFLFQ